MGRRLVIYIFFGKLLLFYKFKKKLLWNFYSNEFFISDFPEFLEKLIFYELTLKFDTG